MSAKLLPPLFALLLLSAVEVVAQPTCFVSSRVSPDCPLFTGDVVFLGRAVSLLHADVRTGELAESKVLTGYPRGRVTVEVEELFKGQAGAVVELEIRGGCYGHVEKGKRYIFNLGGSPGEYHSLTWYEGFDSLSEGDAAKLLDRVRVLLKGGRQPALVGTLYNASRRTLVEGVTVVAEGGGGRVESLTDSAGRYEFSELPDGEYKA